MVPAVLLISNLQLLQAARNVGSLLSQGKNYVDQSVLQTFSFPIVGFLGCCLRYNVVRFLRGALLDVSTRSLDELHSSCLL